MIKSEVREVALMMEPAITSETSVELYQPTRRYNPEDSCRHPRYRENMKLHLELQLIFISLR
jgi:hypothetical protein